MCTKPAAGKSANAVTQDGGWSLMLHDEPPARMPTTTTTPEPTMAQMSDQHVGPRDQPILPILSKQEAALTGSRFFPPAFELDDQQYPPMTSEPPTRPHTATTVVPTDAEVLAMIDQTKFQVAARRKKQIQAEKKRRRPSPNPNS